MKNIVWKILFSLIILLSILGCDKEIEVDTNSTKSVNAEVISGAVVSAPVDGAKVEAYINGIWVEVGKTQKGNIHFSDLDKITSYPALLRANSRRQGLITKDTYLQAELRGIMMSRNDSPYLTPVTTLAAILFQQKGSSATAALQAKTIVTNIVQNVLGFYGFDPFTNPLGDNLPKHEVLQQTFLLVLNLGEETDYYAMQNFIPTLTAIAEQMQTDTFLGAANKLNPTVNSDILAFLTAQRATIVQRASMLLYDRTKEPLEQERERLQLESQMNEIMSTELATAEHAESFVLTEIVEGSEAFTPISSLATLQKTNPIPLHFRVSLLSNANTIAELTANKTKNPTPTYSGKFTISKIPSAGTLNEGILLSPNTNQKITSSNKVYANGSEFSLFFDCKSVPVGSTHKITFVSTEDPKITGQLTFEVQDRDSIIIQSVQSTGALKLFTFDEGNNLQIAAGAVATLSEGQLAATIATTSNMATPEDVFNTVMVQFTAPSGFAFRGNGFTRTSAVVAVIPTSEDNNFTFTLPSTLDLIATAPSSIGKKEIQIDVLDQETKKVVKQTHSDVYFVPQSSLGTVAAANISTEPESDVTYSKDESGKDITVDSLVLSCELKTWYDLAEVPKDQQPEFPITQYPAIWKLRFNHADTGNNGFRDLHGSYSTELDLRPYASVQNRTPMKFELKDFRADGWKDCRMTIKPFSPQDRINLYFGYFENPDKEYVASGNIVVREE